jgi:hypothetical protein
LAGLAFKLSGCPLLERDVIEINILQKEKDLKESNWQGSTIQCSIILGSNQNTELNEFLVMG